MDKTDVEIDQIMIHSQRNQSSPPPTSSREEKRRSGNGAIEASWTTGTRNFLSALFEDTVVEHNSSSSRTKQQQEGAVVVERSRGSLLTPSAAFRHQLNREMAKPQVLNFFVTTDRVPLTTKTTPVSFTAFDITRHLHPEDHDGAFLLMHSRAAATSMYSCPNACRLSRDVTNLQPVQNLSSLWMKSHREGGRSVFYDEPRMLQEAHMDVLRKSIATARRRSPLQTQLPLNNSLVRLDGG